MKLNRFVIGSPVFVKAILESKYDNGKKILYKNKKNKIGFITGISRRQEGVVRGDQRSPRFSFDYDYEPPYLKITKTVKVWLVRFAMCNKECAVLDEDVSNVKNGFTGRRIVFDGLEIKPVSPLYENPEAWTDEQREFLSEDVKNQKRDAKGRWVKK